MTKQQVLTKLNERLAKWSFKAHIHNFDTSINHCDIVITEKHGLIIAVMQIKYEDETFLVYNGQICDSPHNFVRAIQAIEGEDK